MSRKKRKPSQKSAPQKGSHHDRFFKAGFSDLQAAEELVGFFLSRKEAAACNWTTLRAEKDSFKGMAADLLYSIRLKSDSERKIRFCLLVEHKSKFDSRFFYQILKYKTAFIGKSLEENEEVWPVIAAALYHGKIPWKWEKSLKKGLWGKFLGKIPSSLSKDMLDCGIRVVDIRDRRVRRAIQNRNCKSRGFLNMLTEVWSLKPDAEKLKKALILFKNWHGDKEDLALTVGNYLQATVPGMNEKLLKELDQFAVETGVFSKGGYMTAREYIKEEGRREGMQQGVLKGRQEGVQQGIQQGREEGMQQGRQEGMQQGVQQGVQQGREEERRQVALSMLKRSLDVSLIVAVTGLSEAEIIKLKNGS